MYQPALELLNKKTIIFVDDSPERVSLLKHVGLRITACNSTPTENFISDDFWSVSEYVETTVLHKVLETEKLYNSYGFSPDIIISCQTFVKLDATIYKSREDENVFKTLKMLTGKSYIVHAGVVIKAGDKVVKFTESTKVFIKELTESNIRVYISTEAPFDKAMPYGIYGITGNIVDKIEGDIFTVIGLPLFRLTKELEKLVS